MKKPAKVIPLGAPLNTPDADLDMLALVTPSDIEEAKADARARMGKKGRGAAGDRMPRRRRQRTPANALPLGT
jgi:hypothetical protein